MPGFCRNFLGRGTLVHQDTEEHHTEFKDKPSSVVVPILKVHVSCVPNTWGGKTVEDGGAHGRCQPWPEVEEMPFGTVGVTSKATDSRALNTIWHFSTSNPTEHQSFHTTGPVNTPRRSPCPTHELNWGTANSTPQIPEQDYRSTGNTAQTSCLLLLALNTKPRFLCWLIFRMQKL